MTPAKNSLPNSNIVNCLEVGDKTGPWAGQLVFVKHSKTEALLPPDKPRIKATSKSELC